MKTRDRILECALQLFNQKGEPNVSTMEVANEMGISPGNLYYHFHGKEPLVIGLFERFQGELAPLLDPPAFVLCQFCLKPEAANCCVVPFKPSAKDVTQATSPPWMIPLPCSKSLIWSRLKGQLIDK